MEQIVIHSYTVIDDIPSEFEGIEIDTRSAEEILAEVYAEE